ncbi:MAG: hypothetical protein RJA81_422 [Planctomycetota bacterium]|jgi:purine-binding chemotaxis protein CheW
MNGQWVVFQTGGQEYALSVDQVVEVLRMAMLTSVADAPSGFAGILNLRGQAVPVLDLVARLGGMNRQASLDQAIVIVQVDGRLVGLIVDAVDEVITLETGTIKPADPLLGSRSYYLGVARWEQRVIMLIDVDRLVREEYEKVNAHLDHALTRTNLTDIREEPIS